MIRNYERYTIFALISLAALLSLAGAVLLHPWLWLAAALFLPLSALGIRDLIRTRHAILRNYPVIGHIRFLAENFRPEIRQYLFEGDQDELPFSRQARALVYQRAKGVEDKRPFGTIENVYGSGYSWLTHSATPVHNADSDFRVTIGGSACRQPYSASLYNISAMSFGALSGNASWR